MSPAYGLSPRSVNFLSPAPFTGSSAPVFTDASVQRLEECSEGRDLDDGQTGPFGQFRLGQAQFPGVQDRFQHLLFERPGPSIPEARFAVAAIDQRRGVAGAGRQTRVVLEARRRSRAPSLGLWFDYVWRFGGRSADRETSCDAAAIASSIVASSPSSCCSYTALRISPTRGPGGTPRARTWRPSSSGAGG